MSRGRLPKSSVDCRTTRETDVNRPEAIVFGILTTRDQVEDAARGSVCKAYNEKTLKPHLTD